MDEKKGRESHSFTWGMLVGGAMVLLLTTKKGRTILKEISEGGIEGIEEFIDIEMVKELSKEFSGEDTESINETNEEKTTKKKKRRLFRGVRK